MACAIDKQARHALRHSGPWWRPPASLQRPTDTPTPKAATSAFHQALLGLFALGLLRNGKPIHALSNAALRVAFALYQLQDESPAIGLRVDAFLSAIKWHSLVPTQNRRNTPSSKATHEDRDWRQPGCASSMTSNSARSCSVSRCGCVGWAPTATWPQARTAAAPMGLTRRCGRLGPGQGQRQGRTRRRAGAHGSAARAGDACAGQRRCAADRHLARMGGAPCPIHARPLLRQRPGAVLLRAGASEAGAVDVGVHAQPALCRPGAATRLAQAADLADGARPVCQRHALRGRLVAAALAQRAAARAMGAVRAAPRSAACHRGGRAGARARRHGPGGTGGQDHRHDTPSTKRGWRPSGTRACTWSSTVRRWCGAMSSTRRCSTP